MPILTKPTKTTDTGHLATSQALIDRYNAMTWATDYASIQAAIDALPAAGGRVVIPPGAYALAQPLLYRSGVWLEGAGRGTTIITYDGVGFAVDNADSLTVAKNVHISGLTIRATNPSDTTNGIDLHSTQDCIVEDCYLTNFHYGITFTCDGDTVGCWWNAVRHCKFDNCLESVRYQGAGDPNANTVTGCNIHMRSGVDAIGINVDIGDTASLINNQVESFGANGTAIRVNGDIAKLLSNRIERVSLGVRLNKPATWAYLMGNSYANTTEAVSSATEHYAAMDWVLADQLTYVQVGISAALPAPSATHRGKLAAVYGPTGDHVYICLQSADLVSYEWVLLH